MWEKEVAVCVVWRELPSVDIILTKFTVYNIHFAGLNTKLNRSDAFVDII